MPRADFGPKATSVTVDGAEDGFVPEAGWEAEMTPRGDTRLVVSVPHGDLPAVHAALIAALSPPLGLLYRQEVDRRNPRPQGAPPRDLVALDLPADRVIAALGEAAPLVYGDARCEVWIRGRMGEQVVLDHDGLIYVYPDDPAFRDAVQAAGVPGRDVVTMAERDYVKHWFHAENDALEDALIASLRLTEVPLRRA